MIRILGLGIFCCQPILSAIAVETLPTEALTTKDQSTNLLAAKALSTQDLPTKVQPIEIEPSVTQPIKMAPIGGAPPIKIRAVTSQYYPMNYTEGSDQGPVFGFATDLVKAMFQEAKIAYEIEMLPWARAMQTIENSKNILIFSIVRTKVREEKFQWIGEIWPLKFSLYGLTHSIVKLPRTLDEATEYRVAVGRSAPAKAYLKGLGFKHLKVVNDQSRFWLLLQRDRIDLFPASEFSIAVNAERNNMDADELTAYVELNDLSAPLYIAMSRDSDAELVRTMQAAFRQIKTSGKYDWIIGPLRALTYKTTYKDAYTEEIELSEISRNIPASKD